MKRIANDGQKHIRNPCQINSYGQMFCLYVSPNPDSVFRHQTVSTRLSFALQYNNIITFLAINYMKYLLLRRSTHPNNFTQLRDNYFPVEYFQLHLTRVCE